MPVQQLIWALKTGAVAFLHSLNQLQRLVLIEPVPCFRSGNVGSAHCSNALSRIDSVRRPDEQRAFWHGTTLLYRKSIAAKRKLPPGPLCSAFCISSETLPQLPSHLLIRSSTFGSDPELKAKDALASGAQSGLMLVTILASAVLSTFRTSPSQSAPDVLATAVGIAGDVFAVGPRHPGRPASRTYPRGLDGPPYLDSDPAFRRLGSSLTANASH